MQTHVPSRTSTRERVVHPNSLNPPQCKGLDEHYTLLYEVHTTVFAVHTIMIVAAFVFVTLVTRLCAGCIIMSRALRKLFPYLNFSDSAVLVPFSHMPHPPHFNPVPLPNTGNLPGRKEHLLHKVGQLPLVGYPHNHQCSLVSKVGKGEIQQLV